MSYLSLGDKNEYESEFFGSSAGGQSSRLVSLFDMNKQLDSSASVNQSLAYSAPKPPKPDKGDKKPSEEQTSSVSAAAAVSAHKYVGNKYQTQGKLGIALLSNYVDKDYKILMYVSKQQPVTTAKITPAFQFNVQPNNYASFYDDQQQTWSVLFGSAELLANFAKQVCLAKYNCSQRNAVIAQDLDLGPQDLLPLVSGDSVETKYTGWLVQPQNGTLGTVFDSNHKTEKTFRFKTGKGKVIKGWEEGMLGLKKGGKRFLVIPPVLAYGSKGAGNRVPPNATLAFEVDILRIKHQNADLSLRSSNSSDSVPQTMHENDSGLEPSLGAAPENTDKESTVRSQSGSLSEKIAQNNAATDSTKAKLLSRMAKVGQQMLPIQATGPVPHEIESRPAIIQPSGMSQGPATLSSMPEGQPVLEMLHSPAHSASPLAREQAYSSNLHAGLSPQVLGQMQYEMLRNTSASQNQAPSAQIPYTGIYHSTPNIMPQYPVTGNGILPTILVESQKQNLELKLVLEKLDQIHGKIDELKKISDSQKQGSNQVSSELMDSAVLSHSIQRIIQENGRLKTQILDRNKQIEVQSDKITDLLQRNQKLVEESYAQMEKRNVSFKETIGQSQEKTLLLEQEKMELRSRLSEASSKIHELQSKLHKMTEKANLLERHMAETGNVSQQKTQDLENTLSALREKLEKECSEQVRLKTTMKEREAVVKKEIHKAHELRSQVEERWREKCKETVSVVKLAAEKKIKEFMAEKEKLSIELETSQKKYNHLRKQATEMKEKYETAFQHLKEEKGLVSGDVHIQVKTVMNDVFQQVRSEIKPNVDYAGSHILRIVLNIIKEKTLQLLSASEMEEDENLKAHDKQPDDEKHGNEYDESVDDSESDENGDAVDPNTQEEANIKDSSNHDEIPATPHNEKYKQLGTENKQQSEIKPPKEDRESKNISSMPQDEGMGEDASREHKPHKEDIKDEGESPDHPTDHRNHEKEDEEEHDYQKSTPRPLFNDDYEDEENDDWTK